MFNPFCLLSTPLLEKFVKAGKKYFVRQTFSQAKDHFDEGIKGYFIFTHYAEPGHAEHHLGAISQDPNRFLYEWNNHEHQQKLILASTQPAGYKIYSSVFEKDWEQFLSDNLKKKVRTYIHLKLGWNFGAGDNIKFDVYSNYGELYAQLKLGTQEVRVKLEDIENLR